MLKTFRLKRTPPLVDLVRMAWRRFSEERCLQSASSLTYTALLALVPILTVALTMMTAFPVFGQLMGHLEQFLITNMLPESAASVVAYTRTFAENAAKLTAIGIGVLFLTAMIVLNTIDRAFNQIWRVPRARNTVQRVFIYWAMLTVGPLLIGASLSVTSWIVSQSMGWVRELPLAGEVLLKMVPIMLTGAAFSLLYLIMPNRRVLLRDALSGGFLAALAFEGMKHGFALYIAHFPTYRTVYGAFASVPIFLLWIYLSWLVVLSGAVITAIMPEWRERASQAEPAPGSQFLDALQILRMLWEAHLTGATVTVHRFHAAIKLPLDRIEAILDAMSVARWTGLVGNGWTLIRDPDAITVADVYRLFVFRTGTRLPTRQSGQMLDGIAIELTGAIEDRLGVSLAELFQRAAGSADEQRPAGTLLRLG